jgi:hypothetical protein
MNAGGMFTFNRAHPKNTSFITQADTCVDLRSPNIESLRTRNGIRFRTNDHKLKREVITSYTPGEFIELLADHVPITTGTPSGTLDSSAHAPRAMLLEPFFFNWDSNAVRGLATSVIPLRTIRTKSSLRSLD